MRGPIPFVPGTIYEISFDYFIATEAQPSTQGSRQAQRQYVFSISDTSGGNAAAVSWLNTDQPAFSADGTSSASIATCAQAKYQPRTLPTSGQWNTAKLVLRPQSSQGEVLVTSEAVANMQIKNFYVRAKGASWCS